MYHPITTHRSINPSIDLTGTNDDEKTAWALQADSSLYYYVNQGHVQHQQANTPTKHGDKTVSLPSSSVKNDKDKYGALRVDFVGLGFSPESITKVFEIVAGLLHLGE